MRVRSYSGIAGSSWTETRGGRAALRRHWRRASSAWMAWREGAGTGCARHTVSEAADHSKLVLTQSPVLLPWGDVRTPQPREPVPQLTQLALDCMARRPELIVDLSGTDEHLAVGLLGRIMRAGRLDFRLACVFRNAGHEAIREAIDALDLIAAVPTHNTLTRHR
eukprot:scaffold196420_cov36-Tisochrysis_lutea.AAC.1